MNGKTTEGTSVTWANILTGRDVPNDPGGDLTAERISILRARAVAYPCSTPFAFTPSHSQALLDALDEVDALSRALDERDADAELINRILLGVPQRGLWSFDEGWPPTWLVEMVEQGDADAMQLARTQIPIAPDAPWYRHAEPPRNYDQAAHAAARRVLIRCKDGSP